jgi:hypothetical protein
MKHIIKVGLLLFFVMPMLLIPSAVYADDGDMNVDVGITTPDTANVGVDINASDANVWINGVDLGAMGAGAVQGSTPNSDYSQVGTGNLPPLSNYGEVAEVSPDGKYDGWLIGWRGYFSPETNVDEAVYKGSGCGGTWGVCDGYPDMWTRRQIAGLAPHFVALYEKMNTVIAAVAKIIEVTDSNNAQLNGNGSVAELKLQLSQLADVSADVSRLEQRCDTLETAVQQQRDDYNKKLTIVASVSAFIFVCFAAYITLLTLYIRRLRSRVQ